MFGAAVTSLIMGGFVVVSRFGVSNLTSAADLTFFRYLSGLILLPVFLKGPSETSEELVGGGELSS